MRGFARTILSVAAVAMGVSQARADMLLAPPRVEGVELLRERLARATAATQQVVPARYELAQAPVRVVVDDEGTAMERTVACLVTGTAATAGTVAYAGPGVVSAFAGNQTVFLVLLGGALFMTYCSLGMVLTPIYVRIVRGSQVEPPPPRGYPRAAVHAINAVAPLPLAAR